MVARGAVLMGSVGDPLESDRRRAFARAQPGALDPGSRARVARSWAVAEAFRRGPSMARVDTVVEDDGHPDALKLRRAGEPFSVLPTT